MVTVVLTVFSLASIQMHCNIKKCIGGFPMRAGDAIHLASLLVARSAVVGLRMTQ